MTDKLQKSFKNTNLARKEVEMDELKTEFQDCNIDDLDFDEERDDDEADFIEIMNGENQNLKRKMDHNVSEVPNPKKRRLTKCAKKPQPRLKLKLKKCCKKNLPGLKLKIKI